MIAINFCGIEQRLVATSMRRLLQEDRSIELIEVLRIWNK